MILELFYEDGHLTDEALQALIREEELDTLQRLEVSEHLSFCDMCTLRYTDLLCEEVLQPPPVPLYGEVMKKIRERARKAFLRRLTTVTAAACLAMIFWWSGVFTFPARNIEREGRPNVTVQADLAKEKPSGLTEIRNNLQQLTSGLGDWMQGFFDSPDKAFMSEKENLHGKK